MKISLVTGGAGFIGSHLCRELQNLEHQVIVLDDLSGASTDNLPSGVHFIRGSIMDQSTLKDLFNNHSIDYVYHLAAYAAEGLSHFIRRFNYENNLIGSINLINESIKHKVRCFVFTSSIAVYGKGQLPLSEDQIPLPEDPYGIAKLAVEQDLKAAHEMFGLNYTIFRPHNVYGEFQNLGDKYRNVVGIFMNQLMRGLPLTVFGDGSQTRAFSYIGDLAPVIAKSINNEDAINQVFNVGADQVFTINQLTKEVSKAMNLPCQVTHLPARQEVVHAYSNHEKATKVFGVIKNTPLEEGLKRMALWAYQTGIKKTPGFSNIEIHEKIPPFWLE